MAGRDVVFFFSFSVGIKERLQFGVQCAPQTCRVTRIGENREKSPSTVAPSRLTKSLNSP